MKQLKVKFVEVYCGSSGIIEFDHKEDYDHFICVYKDNLTNGVYHIIIE